MPISPDGDRAAPPRWSADGLRARLLLAIALPALVGGLVASLIPWPEWQWPGFAIAAFVTVTGAWLWLEATVARRLARMARVLESGGDAPPVTPGGGLSALVEAALATSARARELERGVERLEVVRAGVADLAANAAEWAETERAPAFDPASAPEELAPLAARLALAVQRLEERAETARAVTAQVKETVGDAGARASTLAAAAERQFVEASSLLGVLRGIERAAMELMGGIASLAAQLQVRSEEAETARGAAETWTRVAGDRDAELHRLFERFERARQSLSKVHDAARLAAIESAHAALADGDLEGGDRARLTDALAALVRLMRAAPVEAYELEPMPPIEVVRTPAAPAPMPEPGIGWQRGLERLVEQLEDAIARGEKLVQQAERTSSEAQRAGQGMIAAVDEVDGLVARFEHARDPLDLGADAPAPAPPEAGPAADSADADETADETTDAPAPGPTRPLRVLGPEDLLPDDETWSHG